MAQYLKLKNRGRRPPQGWMYALGYSARGSDLMRVDLVRASSFSTLIREIDKRCMRRGLQPPTEAEVEDVVAQSSLNFDANWDGVQTADGVRVALHDLHRPLPVQVWGPAAWGWLHCLAAVWENDDVFTEAQWRRAISGIQQLLASEVSGCEHCEAHFKDHCSQFCPYFVFTRTQACVWSWHAHNECAPEGRAPMAYFHAAALWGWPTLNEQTVSDTLDCLRSNPTPS